MVHFLKVAARVERRLNAIQNELRVDRDRNAYDRYDELMNLSTIHCQQNIYPRLTL
jgi:hypothetical protein